MATEAAKALVLNGPEDWYDWLDYLKDLSRAKRVWNFVDPDLPDVPDLVEPEIPSPASVKQGAATVTDLDDAEKASLGILQRLYAQLYAQWQARENALQHINEVIKATTGKHY